MCRAIAKVFHGAAQLVGARPDGRSISTIAPDTTLVTKPGARQDRADADK